MKKLLFTLPAIALLACQSTAINKTDPLETHSNILTLDTHVDIPLTYMDEIDPGAATDLQVDLGKLEAGGLDAAFFIVYTPQAGLFDDAYAEAVRIANVRINAIHEMANKYQDRIAFATTAADVRAVVEAGKLVALVGMENAYPLGPSVKAVPVWAERGVRYMGITHFGHNQFGDSSNPHPERDTGPRYNGLSDLGKDLIKALNDNGIMVDVSHAGKDTMMQAADLSRSPIIASHSGVKAIADSARNLDDEQLLKIKAVGGVAQMVALDAYVKPYTDAQTAFRDQVRKEMGLETREARSAMSEEVEAQYIQRLDGMWAIEPRASVADFADHIDHAVKIAGIDHVGIASDFDGGGGIEGWKDATETANVTAELISRGYSNNDIAKIWGGNLLRVMEKTEAVAKTE